MQSMDSFTAHSSQNVTTLTHQPSSNVTTTNSSTHIWSPIDVVFRAIAPTTYASIYASRLRHVNSAMSVRHTHFMVMGQNLTFANSRTVSEVYQEMDFLDDGIAGIIWRGFMGCMEVDAYPTKDMIARKGLVLGKSVLSSPQRREKFTTLSMMESLGFLKSNQSSAVGRECLPARFHPRHVPHKKSCPALCHHNRPRIQSPW